MSLDRPLLPQKSNRTPALEAGCNPFPIENLCNHKTSLHLHLHAPRMILFSILYALDPILHALRDLAYFRPLG